MKLSRLLYDLCVTFESACSASSQHSVSAFNCAIMSHSPPSMEKTRGSSCRKRVRSGGRVYVSRISHRSSLQGHSLTCSPPSGAAVGACPLLGLLSLPNCLSISPVCPRRGLNPPHRVKSISMTTFSQQEVEFLQNHGNEVSKLYFGWLLATRGFWSL